MRMMDKETRSNRTIFSSICWTFGAESLFFTLSIFHESLILTPIFSREMKKYLRRHPANF